MAVGRAVAIISSTDSLLIRVAVGALGDIAEVEVLSSSAGTWHAKGKVARGVAVDAVGAAASLTGDRAGGFWARSRGCEPTDGGEADEERGILHRDQGCGADRFLEDRMSRIRNDSGPLRQ